MKGKILVILQSVFLGLGLLAVTLPVKSAAPGNGQPFSCRGRARHHSSCTEPPEPGQSPEKPLAVWECTTSWYGDDFDACRPLTARPTICTRIPPPTHAPLGSIVRVVNMRNHRSQVVRINDRGPYVEGRELDVSYEVARKLGFDQHGLAKVRLELLKVPARPATAHPGN